MAPTTPDTLSCFPYTNSDPFIFDDYPQVYFAANQKSLQHEIVEGMNHPILLLKYCALI